VIPAGLGGYMNGAYAASLAEYGTPTLLPQSGGWILKRPIVESPLQDAMACYPLFVCPNWEGLQDDLEELDGVVALSAVPDPIGPYDLPLLRRCFPDVVRPFKEHFVTDLRIRPHDYVSSHHRRYATRSLRDVSVELCSDPGAVLDDWVKLYSVLVERHGIVGIAAFSRSSFSGQFTVPGITVFRAVLDGETVGMLLWYVQGEAAYYHLGAYSEMGYSARASFALFSTAIDHFAETGLRWLNLGGGAGLDGEGTDGLSRFKRGWSTGTRMVYFCGRVFDRDAYREITHVTGASASDTYFPVYRAAEFGRSPTELALDRTTAGDRSCGSPAALVSKR
jgi:Acetyltransferase (GNAT) domain